MRRRGLRGLSAFSLLYLILGIGISGLLLHDTARFFEKKHWKRIEQSAEKMREAREALALYMLLRPENELALAAGAVGSVHPRVLMLPCPDNIGDGNLDGSQDVSCSGAPSGNDQLNGVLNGGSRFGRLPWRTKNLTSGGQGISHAINDGIDINVQDELGNRPWYALAHNLAPSRDISPMNIDDRLPMNLHRLVTRREGWLSLRRANGMTVSQKIAAVLLAPGAPLRARSAETLLTAGTAFNHATDVAAADGMLSPQRYFESATIRIGGTVVQTLHNHNADGVFVEQMLVQNEEFNDTLLVLDINELAADTPWFVRVHGRTAGTTTLQNAPEPDRLLGQVTTVLGAYRHLFGFYPAPARLDNPTHLNQRHRQCAQYHSYGAASATLSAGVVLAPAMAVTVQAAPPATLTGNVSVTLTGSAPFLLRERTQAAAIAPTPVRYADQTRNVATLSLAREARLTLQGNALLQVAADALQPHTITATTSTSTVTTPAYLLSAAVRLTLPTAQVARIATRSPLAPAGALLGWLGGHTPPLRRAGNDGQSFTLQAGTRAAFLGAATLTTAARTLTLRRDDVLTLTAGARLRLQQNFTQAPSMYAQVYHADGSTLTLADAGVDEATFNRRQFAVWLQADAVRGTTTLTAPAILFPWRRQIASQSADSRDNLHDYPPCLDARNFYTRRFQEALKDQPLVYAVAAECHQGGNPAACGRSGGLVVSIAASATVALPQAYTLTHSYTVTLGNFLTVSLLGGVPQGGAVTMPRALTFPLLDTAAVTLAAFKLSAQRVLAANRRVVMPRHTPMIGGVSARIVNVPALLIYSPAPVPRAPCRGLFNQLTEADDITDLCYWLDDTENADGDGFFVMYPSPHFSSTRQRNDYFILLGGRARI